MPDPSGQHVARIGSRSAAIAATFVGVLLIPNVVAVQLIAFGRHDARFSRRPRCRC
ncbi:hypothetical protein [Leucobacter tardus]|uniref:Uncharacterized protein n=1 Tax=Leucobacter tardus TaxID=501483 RepID=A0A939QEM4_9MICO|nr:hypothetical protein [Leucobacter tardus]MBO2989748.1 hypothetical protein [Leucobacter tardus]